jgi:hypothetical protein
MAKKISDFTRGYRQAERDIVFNLLWSFFSMSAVDAALKKREAKTPGWFRKLAAPAPKPRQKAKSRAAAAGSEK